MKKVFLCCVLGLLACAGLASYPKEVAPAGYLMVIGSGRPGNSNRAEITIIQPNGRRQVQSLPDIPVSKEGPSPAGAVDIHQAESVTINKLYAQGWRLVSVAQSTVGAGASTETIYLLESR
ncbi:hypothetical protein F1C16_20040 (plasmid) [Hymenobacter sp. NBH84]|uniref:DUF4177 domain-containing protein n=1 Tax=Hymenobacter citatus TaxID=2763506 RepID=A0ABR7MQ71_9BACT|nr:MULTISPECIES: hypothetical protein [Hymenobacter]MBC6613224.1 hypothetical protein [Hymenobacter citatus]QNE41923.1 hypothetical protein F1C16_20040 [Hymenobacter sp. NBH84]